MAIGHDFLPINPKNNPDLSFRKPLVTDVYSVNKTPVHCIIILGQLVNKCTYVNDSYSLEDVIKRHVSC